MEVQIQLKERKMKHKLFVGFGWALLVAAALGMVNVAYGQERVITKNWNPITVVDPVGWQPLALQNGCVNVPGMMPAQYRKDGGKVTIVGFIAGCYFAANGTMLTEVAQLPEGFRISATDLYEVPYSAVVNYQQVLLPGPAGSFAAALVSPDGTLVLGNHIGNVWFALHIEYWADGE
jgi:hypothetical protein